MKRLLWLFKETYSELEYSPLIVHSLSFLLIFLTESEAYFVIKRLLDDSKKILDERNQINSEELRGLRWHFTFYKEDFLKFLFILVFIENKFLIFYVEIVKLSLILLRIKANLLIKLKSISMKLASNTMKYSKNGQ